MASPYLGDGSSIYYRPPTAGQISSESALENWDGSRNQPPRVHPGSMGTLAPRAAPFFHSPQVMKHGRNDARRPTATAQSGYAMRTCSAQPAYSGVDKSPRGSVQHLAPTVSRNAVYSYGNSPEAGTAVPTAGRALRYYPHTHEGPSPPIAVTVPAAPSVTHEDPGTDAEMILGKFYRDRNKSPSYKERVELSESTGMLTEEIGVWFQTKRQRDHAENGRRNCAKPLTRISDAQKATLETYFVKHGTPGKRQRIQLAEELGVGTEFIHNWFRTRRQKRAHELAVLSTQPALVRHPLDR